MDEPEGGGDRYAGLVETLELLVAQARAYERALPPDNFPAHAAVATLGELGRQALREAEDLLPQAAPATQHPLTPRELQVLALAADGLTNQQIAYRLSLSERTVQFHLRSIFTKTDTSSRTEAAVLAWREGWLTPR